MDMDSNRHNEKPGILARGLGALMILGFSHAAFAEAAPAVKVYRSSPPLSAETSDYRSDQVIITDEHGDLLVHEDAGPRARRVVYRAIRYSDHGYSRSHRRHDASRYYDRGTSYGSHIAVVGNALVQSYPYRSHGYDNHYGYYGSYYGGRQYNYGGNHRRHHSRGGGGHHRRGKH